MEKIISSIPVYNLLTNLIPGTVLAALLKFCVEGCDIFSLLANVADVKSLVIHPASTTHSQLSDEEKLEQGIHPNTIRLTIGTENIDDIIADRDEAFKAVK